LGKRIGPRCSPALFEPRRYSSPPRYSKKAYRAVVSGHSDDVAPDRSHPTGAKGHEHAYREYADPFTGGDGDHQARAAVPM